jgi:hypothetical protein
MIATTDRVQRLQSIIEQNRAMAGGAFRQEQLDKELATLAKLTDEMVDLTRVRNQIQVEGGNELIRGLSIQAATFGKSSSEAQRLAIALNQSLTPAQRRAATAILDTIIQLERQKRSAEEAARALERVGGIGPLTFLDLPDLTLKPRIDNS